MDEKLIIIFLVLYFLECIYVVAQQPKTFIFIHCTREDYFCNLYKRVFSLQWNIDYALFGGIYYCVRFNFCMRSTRNQWKLCEGHKCWSCGSPIHCDPVAWLAQGLGRETSSLAKNIILCMALQRIMEINHVTILDLQFFWKLTLLHLDIFENWSSGDCGIPLAIYIARRVT